MQVDKQGLLLSQLKRRRDEVARQHKVIEFKITNLYHENLDLRRQINEIMMAKVIMNQVRKSKDSHTVLSGPPE
jgi:hypothetical protein